uniref:Uncharacterized protein n=1 Tax=Ananas comosus var. bracteatus TaxID=296719 RepID=A0A6V7NR47_ANACO|nr:unnamed protein product [Ananas comosus var. bracteatus]
MKPTNIAVSSRQISNSKPSLSSSNLHHFKQLHAKLFRTGEIEETLTLGKLVADVATSHLSNLRYARSLFSQTPLRNAFMYNSMIRGSARAPTPTNPSPSTNPCFETGFGPTITPTRFSSRRALASRAPAPRPLPPRLRRPPRARRIAGSFSGAKSLERGAGNDWMREMMDPIARGRPADPAKKEEEKAPRSLIRAADPADPAKEEDPILEKEKALRSGEEVVEEEDDLPPDYTTDEYLGVLLLACLDLPRPPRSKAREEEDAEILVGCVVRGEIVLLLHHLLTGAGGFLLLQDRILLLRRIGPIGGSDEGAGRLLLLLLRRIGRAARMRERERMDPIGLGLGLGFRLLAGAGGFLLLQDRILLLRRIGRIGGSNEGAGRLLLLLLRRIGRAARMRERERVDPIGLGFRLWGDRMVATAALPIYGRGWGRARGRGRIRVDRFRRTRREKTDSLAKRGRENRLIYDKI